MIATKHDEMKVQYEELSKLKQNIDKFVNKSDEPKRALLRKLRKIGYKGVRM